MRPYDKTDFSHGTAVALTIGAIALIIAVMSYYHIGQ